MKATGVVRRIDDLGRIVIPKEIRKNLRIREGESLEIYSGNQNEIILKKYSFIESIEEFAKKLCEAFYLNVKKDILITDSEKIIAVSGGFNNKLIGLQISNQLDRIIQKKEMVIFEKENIEICNNLVLNSSIIIKPVLIYGDLIGSIIIMSNDKSIDIDKTLINYLNNLIIKNYEE